MITRNILQPIYILFMIQTTILLTQDQHDALKQHAELNGTSVGGLIRILVTERFLHLEN